MISFFRTNRKLRKQTEEWIRLARKVEDYRSDVIAPNDLAELVRRREQLEQLHADDATPPRDIEKAWENLEPILRRTGGTFYPRTFWAENVEMLLVAAIIVIGIRSFFFQPFKIPTNSMYPSYYGMTTDYFAEPADAPGIVGRVFRLVAFGAIRHELKAPRSGQVSFSGEARPVPGRKYFVLPTTKMRYTFYVDDHPVYLDVPPDFDMNPVVQGFLGENYRQGVLPGGTRVVGPGRQVQAGETFLSFDILTGDQLFVDRVSYHFVRPKFGDPFVFRTDNIPDIDEANRGKYYIKRIAGVPGDSIEIRPPVLHRNGEPATGARAFLFNAEQESGFPGYVNVGPSRTFPMPLHPGTEAIQIPPESYFALGDNSPNSADSRMWGFVPEKEIVGRAILIYYPFTRRWGRSH